MHCYAVFAKESNLFEFIFFLYYLLAVVFLNIYDFHLLFRTRLLFYVVTFFK